MVSMATIENILVLKTLWLAGSALIFLAGVTVFYRMNRSRRDRRPADADETAAKPAGLADQQGDV